MAHQVTSPALAPPEKTTTVDFPIEYVDQNYTHTSVLPRGRSLSDMTVKDGCDFTLSQQESLSSQELRPKPETVQRRYFKVVKHTPSVICFSRNCFMSLNNNDTDEELYVVETHPSLTEEVFQIKQKDLSNIHIKENPMIVTDILGGNVSEVLGQQHNLEDRISRSQSCPDNFKDQRHDNEDNNNSSLMLPWKTDRFISELKAKEVCDWLRAAGFPQYAQLYEDSQFPIDIEAVKKDHDFLDNDSVKSLCRRLMTLNKYASIRLDVNINRKLGDDSEEDDLCAISDRWAFQQDSKRWSRLTTVDFLSNRAEILSSTMKESASRESMLSDLSDPEACSEHCSNGSAGSIQDELLGHYSGSQLEPKESPGSVEMVHSQATQKNNDCSSDNFVSTGTQTTLDFLENPRKHRTKSFLRRIESLRFRTLRGKDKTLSKSKERRSVRTVSQQQNEPLQTTSPLKTLNKTPKGLIEDVSRSNFAPLVDSGHRKHTKAFNSRSSHSILQSGLFLENCETRLMASNHNRKDELYSHEDYVVRIPANHKVGTFPKALSIESLCPGADDHLVNWKSENLSFGMSACSSISNLQGLMLQGRRGSCSSIGSKQSIYDNVPESHPYNDAAGREDLFKQLDDVLKHVNGLQESVGLWSKTICTEFNDTEFNDTESDSTGETVFPLPGLNFEDRSMSDVGTSASDFDSTGNSVIETEEIEIRERRDSGVGASLTRPNRKLRWHSFQNSHRPSLNSASLEINRQSAAQLNLLQRFSLLRLTAIMERYAVRNKQGWNWGVPKFMKRSKEPDYRSKNVFGVPPIVNVKRSGQPIPQSIQQAMRYLRSQCMGQVGIFRKSGVKSRIQALRQMNENSPDNVNYHGQSTFDVADMLKQYFRDLPEPIFTNKLTETFLQIYQYVPRDQRLQALQAAIVLLPDENREVLQSLLYFLSDIASVQENQMTAGNLAVCLAPSLFHLNVPKKEASSPRVIRKRGVLSKPDQRDLNENLAATEGLGHMIAECKKLFQIPHDIMVQSRNSYIAVDAHPLPMEGFRGHHEGRDKDYMICMEDIIQDLLRDAGEKFKGWTNIQGPVNTELSYKKVGDGHPLRLWKVATEIEATPNSVLNRLLRERHLWDDDVLVVNVVEQLDKNMEICHYVLDSMAPHPRRDFVVLRAWRTDLLKEACVLVAVSVEHDAVHLEGGVRAVVLNSQYLVEACGSGRSRLTYISRTDLRGRTPEWYNKVSGYLCAVEVARIRDSFLAQNSRGLHMK
ncbi:stAR-related lipid transfer protein 8 isoform X1 [Stegostoma tigrinum]|uniref:stAR-related lipid transfer protein 8 isoform X1 n=1 Tax=Stegostoma tigrinum TaxID=3053191 RepID=UPI002870254D|nr:stAR-related lipid transfer protein 8 isoform X1 [Stegostoma tigrinum]